MPCDTADIYVKGFGKIMEQMEQGRKGMSSCTRTIIVGVAALVVGLAAGFLLSGGASSMSPMEMVRSLESSVARLTPGDDGALLATIEDEKITRKTFDQQLSLFLKSSQRMSQEEIVKMKNNPAFLRQFLRQLVENRIVLKAMESDPEFVSNPELYVFMNLSLADGLQKYYLYKKSGSISIDTNVSETEIEKTYNQLRADPRYAERLDRVPFDQLKSMLSQEIVKQRQMREVRDLLDKVRGGFRTHIHDEVFGKTAGSTNAPAGILPVQ